MPGAVQFTHPQGVTGSWVQIRQGRMGRRRSNVRRAPVSLHYARKTAIKLSGKARAGPARGLLAVAAELCICLTKRRHARRPDAGGGGAGGVGKTIASPRQRARGVHNKARGASDSAPLVCAPLRPAQISQYRLVLGAREGTETLYTRGSASTHCLRLHSTCSVSFWSPRLISHSASFKTPAPRITKLKLSRVPPPGVRVSS
jgi:hypothetical protein